MDRAAEPKEPTSVSNTPSSNPTSAGEAKIWLAVIPILVALVYAGTLSYPLLTGDQASLQRAVAGSNQLPHAFFSLDGPPAGRGLPALVHAVELQLFGVWAPGFHLTNIVLHALCALLMILALGKITRDHRIALLGGALWAFHPLQSQVVANVESRNFALAAAAVLGAFLVVEGGTSARSIGRIASGAVLLLLAGSADMPSAIVGAALLCAHAWLRAGAAPDRRCAGSFAAITALLFVLAIVGGGSRAADAYEFSGSALGGFDYLRLIGLGLQLVLAPIGLSADYGFDALGFVTGDGTGSQATLQFVLAFVILAAAVVTLLRKSPLAWGLAWFALFCGAHLGGPRVFSEPWVYLASMGLCALAVGMLCRFSDTFGFRPVATGLVVALVLGGALGSVQRSKVWASEQALWSATVERYPNAAQAHKRLADDFLLAARATPAIQHYTRARELLPAMRDARLGLISANAARGRYGSALDELHGMLQQQPDDPQLLVLEGAIQHSLGDNDSALDSYMRAVEVDPDYGEGYQRMGELYQETERPREAVMMFQTAIEHDPTLVQAYFALSKLYDEHLNDPDMADYYENKGRQIVGMP